MIEPGNESNATDSERTRQGAQSGTPLLNFTPELKEGDEWPMVVWLRGDEPYVEDFNLSAQDAMAVLGIKRSRLTQISGEELRVGRIRAGRYIKPVYRAIDLEAYQKWVRPTASSKKSQDQIQSVTTTLTNAIEDLQDHTLNQVHQLSPLLKQTVHHVLADGLQSLQNTVHTLTRSLQRDLGETQVTLRRQLETNAAEISESLIRELDQTNILMGQLQEIYETYAALVEQIRGDDQEARRDLANKMDQLSSQSLQYFEEISTLISDATARTTKSVQRDSSRSRTRLLAQAKTRLRRITTQNTTRETATSYTRIHTRRDHGSRRGKKLRDL